MISNSKQRVCVSIGLIVLLILLTHPPYIADLGAYTVRKGHINIFAAPLAVDNNDEITTELICKNTRINILQLTCEISLVILCTGIGLWALKDIKKEG